MGNSKNTILILVVVGLFVASGVVLYRGFSGGGSTAAGIPDIAGAQKEIVNLLPYGTNLDFAKVKARALSSTPFVYETVDQNNVGIDIHSLITPALDANGQTQLQGRK